MNTYTMYFSIFGKKMKTTVQAKSTAEAKVIIMRKIVFHKVEEEGITLNTLKNIFGI